MRNDRSGKERITLTWSIGVGEGQPGDTVDQILARADAALYDAKLKGRNCVIGMNARVPMHNAVVTEGIVRAARWPRRLSSFSGPPAVPRAASA